MFLSQQIILALTISNSLAINLEKLFKNKISDAKCFSQCQQAETEEEQDHCFVICKTLADYPQEDLCSLTSVCTGGCQLACDAKLSTTEEPSVFEDISFNQCQLSWQLEKVSEKVVFLVAGRDQGGMWNLMENHLTSSQATLTPRQAAKFVEVQVFAISPDQVSDIISVDIRNNDCYETVPVSREWKEDLVSREQDIKDNTSIIATVILSVLGVFAFVFSLALILVKYKRPGVEDSSDYVLELPYSVPGKALRTLGDQSAQNVRSEDPEAEYEVVEINFGHQQNTL